jgi:hypothetical protein
VSLVRNFKLRVPLTVTGHVFGRSTRKVDPVASYIPLAYTYLLFRINVTTTFESRAMPGTPTSSRFVFAFHATPDVSRRTRPHDASRSTLSISRSIGKQVVVVPLRLFLLKNGASSQSASPCVEVTLPLFWTPTGKHGELTKSLDRLLTATGTLLTTI